MRWDIFCKVIDNFGDIGVSWRLACELARRGEAVRLWTDDTSALAWMAPQGCEGVSVIAWSLPAAVSEAACDTPPDVLIEAFGCDPAPEALERFAQGAHEARRVWLNLEYLSAEPYVERLHRLPSPVFRGPGEGLTKYFFYPGFTAGTGGLLHEPGLESRHAALDRRGWLQARGIDWRGERLVSLFCYEPDALVALLDQLATGPDACRLLVTAGRATRAVQSAMAAMAERAVAGARQAPLPGRLSIDYLPLLTQDDYDNLLRACDFNFVRGEDSLVRAIWSRRPFAWQIYPQDDDAHHVKLDALLDTIEAPADLRRFHHAWNGVIDAPPAWPDAAALAGWQDVAERSSARLAALPDLATQLQHFVAEKR